MKISNTILIDKNKGDETEASSYRPVGKYPLQTMDAAHHKHPLRICRSKLHTQHHTLVFAKKKAPDSLHQLEYVIMALEDAKLFHKDIYALIVDFTSAFNTTDHDRMLWIMYDLGFPTDAIDTVKNLYENATVPHKSSFLQGSAQVKYQ